MRIELNKPLRGVEDLQKLCNQAKTERFDAVYVPPFFVETAAAMLGRNQITIVTTAGRDEDLLDTKVMAIEAAARAGANEVIVCPPPQNIADGLWSEVEKEFVTLHQICEMNSLVMWVGCRFAYQNREVQAKICSLIPKQGFCGLRVREADPEDVKMSVLCGVKRFCASFVPDPVSDDWLDQLTEAGVTQFVLREAPKQKKTNDVHVTEVSL